MKGLEGLKELRASWGLGELGEIVEPGGLKELGKIGA